VVSRSSPSARIVCHRHRRRLCFRYGRHRRRRLPRPRAYRRHAIGRPFDKSPVAVTTAAASVAAVATDSSLEVYPRSRPQPLPVFDDRF